MIYIFRITWHRQTIKTVLSKQRNKLKHFKIRNPNPMGRYLGREYGVLRCQFVTVNHALLLLTEIFGLNCKSNIHSWLSNIGTVNGQVFAAPLKQLGHYVPTTTRQVQFQFSLPISASHWDSFWSPFQLNGIASCNWCRWWSIMRYDSMLFYSALFCSVFDVCWGEVLKIVLIYNLRM